MDKFSYLNNANPAYIESLYTQYKADPTQLDDLWHRFFEGYEFSRIDDLRPVSDGISSKEVAVIKLINAYRSRGHLIANTNPIRARRKHKADLELDYFGLTDADLDTEFESGTEISIGKTPLRHILDHLRQTYCDTIGVEFMYCRNPELRQWIYKAIEPIANKPTFSKSEKSHILDKINQAVHFESFLHTKYVGQKRFSLEGAESLIPALDSLITVGSELGAREFIVGMAHRGRLNVLANVFGKSYEQIFSEFDGNTFDEDIMGDGDVKYHLGQSSDIVLDNGEKVHLSLVPNPSHLEAVNPVVEGLVYAKKYQRYDNNSDKIVPVLIHGDSAIAGQGINYEVTNMSKLPGYDNGGTIHIVINNQLGFTTSYLEARSSVYCTDLAKVTESPVFHVSADDPCAVVHAVRTAMAIRQAFKIDVYIDILGYRRYGHNEGDEPRFTQPSMYSIISKHKNIFDRFSNQLIAESAVTADYVSGIVKTFKSELQKKMDLVREQKPKLKVHTLNDHWGGFRAPKSIDFDQSIQTGVPQKTLDSVATSLTSIPSAIEMFSKTKKLVDTRQKQFFTLSQVDWSLGELLAYGSLLVEGKPVRISGQDCQRGTFSHRHSVIKHGPNDDLYVPLNNIAKKQAEFTVYNSLLSEYCVLGFEVGYSWAMPHGLVIWEAQFGDFSNGAQIIIDQYLSSSASKWHRYSGLVLLLPHGYEGQGPEHSSARLERYLQLCAEDNMYVTNVTTPANYFHMIRRQLHNEFRIPLVVMSPKSLLRHPKVVSPVSELTTGAFQEVIDDQIVKPSQVKRVIVCSGKFYYDLLNKQDGLSKKDTAIIRLEQLYPMPKKQLDKLKKRYKSATTWIWAQEEPENMGAWAHVLRHLPSFEFNVVARKPSASPAPGNSKEHDHTQLALVDRAFSLVN